jgi:hypothetical protein
MMANLKRPAKPVDRPTWQTGNDATAGEIAQGLVGIGVLGGVVYGLYLLVTNLSSVLTSVWSFLGNVARLAGDLLGIAGSFVAEQSPMAAQVAWTALLELGGTFVLVAAFPLGHMAMIVAAACQGAVTGVFVNLVHRVGNSPVAGGQKRPREHTGGPFLQFPIALAVGIGLGVAGSFFGALSVPDLWMDVAPLETGLGHVADTLGVLGPWGGGGGPPAAAYFGFALLLLLLTLALILAGALMGAALSGIAGPVLSFLVSDQLLGALFKGRAKSAAREGAGAVMRRDPQRSPLKAARHGAITGGWTGYFTALGQIVLTCALNAAFPGGWENWLSWLIQAAILVGFAFIVVCLGAAIASGIYAKLEVIDHPAKSTARA